MGPKRKEVHDIVAFADGLDRLTLALMALVGVWALYATLTLLEGRCETFGNAVLAAACTALGVQSVAWGVTKRRWDRVAARGPAKVQLEFNPPPVPGGDVCDEVQFVMKAGQLRSAGQYIECRRVLQEGRAQHPGSAKLAALYCRACSDEASTAPRGELREAALRRGLPAAAFLVARHPSLPDGYKWRAVLASRLLYFMSIKDKLLSAGGIRDDVMRAMDLDPEDALTLHMVGAYCHRVAAMSWIERRTAQGLLATPLAASHEQALQHLLRADSIEGFMENSMLLGDVYKALGKPAEAVQWYRTARSQMDGPRPAERWGEKLEKRIAACEAAA